MGVHLRMVLIADDGDEVGVLGGLFDDGLHLEHHGAGGIDHLHAPVLEGLFFSGEMPWARTMAISPAFSAVVVDVVDDPDPPVLEGIDDLGVVDDLAQGIDPFIRVFLPHLEGDVDGPADTEAEACVARDGDLHRTPLYSAWTRYSWFPFAPFTGEGIVPDTSQFNPMRNSSIS